MHADEEGLPDYDMGGVEDAHPAVPVLPAPPPAVPVPPAPPPPAVPVPPQPPAVPAQEGTEPAETPVLFVGASLKIHKTTDLQWFPNPKADFAGITKLITDGLLVECALLSSVSVRSVRCARVAF